MLVMDKLKPDGKVFSSGHYSLPQEKHWIGPNLLLCKVCVHELIE